MQHVCCDIDAGPSLAGSFSCVFSSRSRHTRCYRDWSSDVCSSDLWVGHSTDGYGFARALLSAGEPIRSEERRVGKEGRSRWAPDYLKKKKKAQKRAKIVYSDVERTRGQIGHMGGV